MTIDLRVNYQRENIFNDFSAEVTQYILNCLTQPKVYTTKLEEYGNSRKEEVIAELKSRDGFP